MRFASIALVVVMVTPHASAQVAQAAPATLRNLEWLSGCWALGGDKPNRSEEFWSSPNDRLMLSVTRQFEGGKAAGWEFTRIEATDSGVVWAVQATGMPETRYRLVAQSADSFVVENLKEKPQRFIYRRATDSTLTIRVEQGSTKYSISPVRTACAGPKR